MASAACCHILRDCTVCIFFIVIVEVVVVPHKVVRPHMSMVQNVLAEVAQTHFFMARDFTVCLHL